MIIGWATSDDLDAVERLERAGFGDRRWSRASWAEAVASVRTEVLVARQEAVAQGVIVLSVAGDVADLDRIIVGADHRGAGVARRLLVAGSRAARKRGARRILLEVAETNQAALKLYRAAGFGQIGTRRDYYGPGQDALIMECPLSEGNADE
ncbi:MAG: GNAT family N-acetyltransferase [Propioniciclava sp.]